MVDGSTKTRVAVGVPQPVICEIERVRLRAAFGDLVAGRRQLVCVWAAAGSGKTVLLASWARAAQDAGHTVHWIAAGGHGHDPAAQLQEIAGMHDPSETTVVFIDDVHAVTGQHAVARLHSLVQTLPDGLRVVLGGRYQPFPSVTYLEASGAMTELRTAELSFTTEEAASLAARNAVRLPEAALVGLLARTGGWVTALALAMTLLRDAAEPASVIERFSGDDRAVADFLVTEVLAALEPEERDLLLSVAVADRVPLELAVELSGRADAGAMFHRLAHRNTLIIDGPDDVRYHPVLLAFLRAEARRVDAIAARRQHAVAARWYSVRGDGAAALEHASESGDQVAVVDALERFGIDLALSGRSTVLVNAIARLHVEREPRAAQVVKLLIEAPHFIDAPRARHLFAAVEAAERTVDADEDADADAMRSGLWDAVVYALRCLQPESDSDLRGRLARLRADDVMALRDENTGVDLLATAAEAWGMSRLGRSAEAIRLLGDTASSAARAGYELLDWIASEMASTIAASVGRWEESVALEDGVADRAQSRRFSLRDRAGAGAVLMRAGRTFQRCIPMPFEQLERLVALDPLGTELGLVIPARMLRLLPELDSDGNPRTVLDEVERLMRESGARFPRLLAASASRMVGLRLSLDGRARAMESLEVVQRGLGADSLESIVGRFVLEPPARPGDAAEARVMSALTGSARSWHAAAAVDAWLVLARSAQTAGRIVEADARLARALELAARFGAARPFVSRGGDGVALLTERMGRLGHNESFAATIIERAERVLPPDDGRRVASAPLTGREREILQELPMHQSVAEIARRQMLSVNTIKTHLRSIYQKLGAADRSEAVLSAQRRGLL